MADVYETGMSNALAKQPRLISYPDFKPIDDFESWLTGYEAKIRASYGFKLDEADKVEAEVVRSISARLTVGSALNAYNSLKVDEKSDYKKLVEKLNEEFVDPQKKRRFLEKMDFNKRRKGQSVKEFMQEIKKDMNRYTTLPKMIKNGANAMVENPERERQGVRRFRNGMRDGNGKKDVSLAKLLNFHLMEDSELKWDNAIKIAHRWEMAENLAKLEMQENSDDSESEDEVKVVDVRKKRKCKAKPESESAILSSLSDQVHINQMKIKGLETAQERFATAQQEINTTLQSIAAKLDMSYQQPYPQQQSYYQQQQDSQEQPRFYNPYQPQQWYQPPPQQVYNQNFQPWGQAPILTEAQMRPQSASFGGQPLMSLHNAANHPHPGIGEISKRDDAMEGEEVRRGGHVTQPLERYDH